MELVSEGILSCWHGHYHYVEPWTGCEHNCLYCYAKFRQPVLEVLGRQKSPFQNPVLSHSETKLTFQLAQELEAKQVVTAKLCRYTDLLSPRFVASGLAYQVIETIGQSNVRRVIITTKGVPNPKIIQLLGAYQPKISYNIGVRPEHPLTAILEPGVPPLAERIKSAQALAQLGVEVTVHIDPIFIGWDDQPKWLDPLLDRLAQAKLRKVVFSYLLLNEQIISALQRSVGMKTTERLLKFYQRNGQTQIANKDGETCYWQIQTEYHRQSILNLSEKLKGKGFDFALCSLKAKNGVLPQVRDKTPICYGSFYA